VSLALRLFFTVKLYFICFSCLFKKRKKYPKFVSGEWTEEQVLQHFLNSIDTPCNPDGKVTREEFINYYAGVSSTVDDDSYFDLMMRACYGLPNRDT
jgi:hypothetical protein